jgi:hypothetical protein
MKLFQLAIWTTVQCLIQIGLCVSPHAFELNGAWAAEKAACPKIFIKNEASIAFAPNSELWGKGFIVEGNSIKGQRISCAIKHRKTQSSELYLLTQCADDIMIDQVQLHLKITGDNSITRYIPAIEGLESTYVRCAF